jgi:hypothetical protein
MIVIINKRIYNQGEEADSFGNVFINGNMKKDNVKFFSPCA